MNITLKKLMLENFKGIKSLSIDFSQKTEIYGRNATGKTTVFDAFAWLLFSKDSQGSTNFEIKTLDENNKVIDRLVHCVEGILSLDGKEITLKKVHSQKWVKKKGATEETLDGSENQFYWNDVPLKEKEYQEKIKEIIDPDLFVLITNPNKFNALNWKNKREILFELAGGIKDEEIIAGNKKLTPLLPILEDKTLEEYKKEISAKKAKLSKDLESIGPRIDEVYKSVNIVPECKDISALKIQLAKVESSLLDSQKAYEEYQLGQREHQSQIGRLEIKMLEIKQGNVKAEKAAELEKSNKVEELIEAIAEWGSLLTKLEADTKTQKEKLLSSVEKLEDLRMESRDKKSEIFIFDDNLCVCPICKRAFEETDIEVKKAEMEANFNTAKAVAVEGIKAQGLEIKALIEKTEQAIKENESKLAEGNSRIERLNADLKEIEESPLIIERASTTDLEILIEDIKDTLIPYSNEAEEEQKQILKAQKELIQEEIEQSQKALLLRENNQKAEKRVFELEDESRKIAKLIAELEGQDFLIEEFTKDKVAYTEDKINCLFTIARFKMFHHQVNGGVAETCETLHKGVPYSDLNTAAKINIGLDIINVLTSFYGVTAPIFIDNRESVTKIIETDSQIVNLTVSGSDENLRIEG